MKIHPVLIESALEIAEKLDAKALVIMEEIEEEKIPETSLPVVLVGSSFDVEDEKVKRVSIPQNLDLNNVLNLISAFLLEHNIVSEGDSFVYVTEDAIGIKTVKKGISAMKSFFAQNQSVLQRMLEIAIELSIEGREGTPVGTIFVIGDTRRVLKHSHQLIPNPFKGHKINVLDRDSKEIIKEFAQLDGAFVIREDGRIVSAGRYLEVEPKVIDLMLPPGLGSRHIAAAGITKLTKAMAISLSESGTIRIFKNGLMLLEYNPRLRY
ncbi:diadenylate cyclase [Thermococcus sp. 21S9]|uniref:DNA integrity scanning protein DisA nucleotide-binding domain protein n=1 Tax=Thermococcus sp. 21S9 TaxID=1638223 RepID=UPI00143A5817|nr:diadenylate cyclase [Thermococcus sp. 21S9]NJE55550.1 diadenylate cyclase [Thermococcus sp. 21S9]